MRLKLKPDIEMVAIITGRVQGVGFRAVTKNLADQLGLFGSASNLSDGSVKIIAQGPKEKLEQLIEMLKKEFGNYIQDIDISFRPSSQKQETFKSY